MLPEVQKLNQWRSVRLALAVHRRASADDVGTLAPAVTHAAFLSLFPILLLALSAVGFLLAGHPDRVREWVDAITGAIPGLADLVGRNLKAAVDGRIATGLVGLLGVMWAASGLANALQHALGVVFRSKGGSALRRRSRSLAIMGGLGVVGLASIALTSWAVALVWSGVVVGVAVDLGFFLLAYRGLTPGGPSFRRHLPGAVVMAVAWTALKVAGSWYAIRVVGRATALYGTVGAVFGLLAILSLASRAFLYGAELSAVLAEDAPPADPGDSRDG